MPAALSISNLAKTYGNDVEALKGISLEVEEGDFFALLGPNGAGKSTTIGILFSLINKTSGKLKVFGIDTDENFADAKKLIGIVPQEFNFNVFEKVEHIVTTQGGYYGLPPDVAKQRTEKYLTKLGLWEKRQDMARELSGGMKRRLMIARALVHEPKLLVLDEPTAGVDIEMRRAMWDFMRELNESGTTIILTTHYLEEAEMLCRNIAIINEGTIIEQGSMRDLLQQLNTESFLLDVDGPVPDEISVAGYEVRKVDDHCLEADVHKGQGINDLFDRLSKQNIKVSSMRNKANRLEETFVRLLT